MHTCKFRIFDGIKSNFCYDITSIQSIINNILITLFLYKKLNYIK